MSKIIDRDPLRDFAERYTAAWCSQNAASVASFYSPDGSLQVNDGPPAAAGLPLPRWPQGFMSAFPDMKVIMDDLEIEENFAIYSVETWGPKRFCISRLGNKSRSQPAVISLRR